jgi:hypothetical protein
VDTLETESHPERLGDDLLFGAQAIAEFVGVEIHQIHYLYRMKRLPIGRLGKRYVASKRKLRRAAQACTA